MEPTTSEVVAFHADTDKALATFSPADAAIAQMRDAYMRLSIDGVEDRAGYNAVHDARMVVKRHRVAIEKTRKDLKADALEYGRKVDAEAARLTALLEPIESHLETQEKAVDAEKARIKAEAEAARKKRLDDRMAALWDVNGDGLPSEIEALDDGEFQERLAAARAKFERDAAELKAHAEAEAARAAQEAEAKRKAEEAAAEARRLEDARLAEERAKLDAERKAHEEAQREADKQRRQEEERIAAAQRAVQERLAAERRKLDEERAQIEREKRQREEDARREQEALERAEREKREQEARAAELAMRRSDDEKLIEYAKAVKAVALPRLKAAPIESDLVDARNEFVETTLALVANRDLLGSHPNS